MNCEAWLSCLCGSSNHRDQRCKPAQQHPAQSSEETFGGFTKGILRGVRCTKSLRVLFLHRRPPSWTTLVLFSSAVFIFNEPAYFLLTLKKTGSYPLSLLPPLLLACMDRRSIKDACSEGILQASFVISKYFSIPTAIPLATFKFLRSTLNRLFP